MNTTPIDETDDVPTAYEPGFAIKKLLGEDTTLTELFSPEKIKTCQKLLDDARVDFFVYVQGELKNLDEAMAKVARSSENNDAVLDDIGKTANNIKGQSELFGFNLISNICVQIIDCCQSTLETVSTRLSLMKELISALHLAIQNKITDDGGEIGQELLADLDKYRVRKKSSKT